MGVVAHRSRRLRVSLADDHPFWCQQCRQIIQRNMMGLLPEGPIGHHRLDNLRGIEIPVSEIEKHDGSGMLCLDITRPPHHADGMSRQH